MDEVFLRIGGKQHYLWRAVDQDDNVLDVRVQSRRNAKAAKRFFRKLLRGLQYAPRVIVTDKLKSYAAAKREILPHTEHRQGRYLNNRAEVSHQPTRRRERQMQRFRSASHAQRFSPAIAGSTTTFSFVVTASPPRLSLCPRRCVSYVARCGRRYSSCVKPWSATNPRRRLDPQPDNAPHSTVHNAIVSSSWRSCRPALPVRGSARPSQHSAN